MPNLTANLTASVGQGGRNLSPDVLLVQGLLKAGGFDPGKPDGRCGPMTIAARRDAAAGQDAPGMGRRPGALAGREKDAQHEA